LEASSPDEAQAKTTLPTKRTAKVAEAGAYSFINLFIARLKSSGIGCHINSVFYGYFLYADDIIVLSPSGCELQVMLDNCYHTSTLLSLRFDHLKFHCIIFGKSYKLSTQPMMLGFNCIQWVDCIRYLGVHVCSGKNLAFDIAPV